MQWVCACVMSIHWDWVCVCLSFLKPKKRINKKASNILCLVEPKTQLFKKSCVLDSGKTGVQNALHLWTSEVHKWKRAAARFWLLPLAKDFTKMSLISQTLRHTDTNAFLSQTHFSHLFALHAARPHPHASQPRLISTLYSMVSFFLFFFFLSLSSSTRFWSCFFFFFLNFNSV